MRTFTWKPASGVPARRAPAGFTLLELLVVAAIVAILTGALVLGFVGANPPEGAWIHIGRVATAWYFFHFLILLPLLGWFEKPRPLPLSIAKPVLAEGAAGEGRPAP